MPVTQSQPRPRETGEVPASAGVHAVPAAAGFLAAIDGQSGVGKTTVAALAGARLTGQGFSVLVTGQPSDSAMGKLARASTHDLHGLPLSFLMAADRYYHQDHVIIPALEAGQVVVCDRYVMTALVLDQLDGADPGFIWGIYRYMRWPDLAATRRCAAHARQPAACTAAFTRAAPPRGRPKPPSTPARPASWPATATRSRSCPSATAPLNRSPTPSMHSSGTG